MYNEDPYYNFWNQKMIVAECLRSLGFENLAQHLHKSSGFKEIDEYTKLAEKLAQYHQNTDVLDRLYFSGLIYG